MSLFLFILVNAVLLLRPADLVPELRGLGIYYGVLAVAWIAALPRLLRSDTLAWLFGHPASWCVLAMQAAVVLSHLGHGRTFEARFAGMAYLEVTLFYFLLLLVLDTPDKLRRFLPWLCLLIAAHTTIAVLEYFGVIHLESYSALLEQKEFDPATGDYIVVPRLIGLGFFNDPNDLCLLLVIGMGIAGWQAASRGRGLARLVFLAGLLFFAFAVVLTQSRGGLMGVLAGLSAYAWMRWGWRKAALVGVIALPLLAVLMSGRIARVSTDEDTAQQRIQLWSEALTFFRENPLHGIGMGQFVEECGLVTHNTFLQSYAELGFLGGTAFLGAFGFTLYSLYLAREQREQAADPYWSGLVRFLFAIMAGLAMGLTSVSRAYIPPTYLMVGVGVAYSQLAVRNGAPALRMDGKLLAILLAGSVLFVIGTNIFVRLNVVR